nr:shikimate dehydrogenase [Xanthomonadales bacterium]NIX12230.1 shikimate dehydrogenase [Xanthomonadales bacterium]
QLTPTAQAIGAVNTIVSKNGALTGDNTDAPGFLHDLERLIGEEDQGDGHALILGAGGSAKAVAYALYNAGWEVTVAARRIEQAQALARRYAFSTAAFELPEAGPFTLIINTTPLGMTPNEHTSPWPIGRPLPPNAAVYDLVYNPSETKLVREARAAGLRAATGAGMLIEQAALSFETWTGCSPPRAAIMDAMRQR